VIEVALLNYSHVVAIITDQTRGSMWVPYEYSRIKEDQIRSTYTACRCFIPTTSADFPEYLYLGEMCEDDNQLKTWFKTERDLWEIFMTTPSLSCPSNPPMVVNFWACNEPPRNKLDTIVYPFRHLAVHG